MHADPNSLNPSSNVPGVACGDIVLRLRSAVSVLESLEWSARYSYCTGWSCCPVCKGIKPGHGADEAGRLPGNQGHREECKLAAAISPQNSVIQPTKF